jgi:hypothetical protein
MEQEMQQKALSLMQFQKKFGTEKPVRNIWFACVGQRDFVVPAANIMRLIFIAPATYTDVRPAAIKPL